jgi:hypothetical protein
MSDAVPIANVAPPVRIGQRLGGRRDCPSSADAAVRRLDGGASRLVPGAVGASSKSASTGSSLPRKSRASHRSLTAPWQPARRSVSQVARSRCAPGRAPETRIDADSGLSMARSWPAPRANARLPFVCARRRFGGGRGRRPVAPIPAICWVSRSALFRRRRDGRSRSTSRHRPPELRTGLLWTRTRRTCRSSARSPLPPLGEAESPTQNVRRRGSAPS